MTTGLVLGKFAPLHKGHQLLVEAALAENDRVVVMIYHAPDVTNVPLPVRSRWLRALYPGVEIIEAWDGPLEVGDGPELKRLHEAYIRDRLGNRKIDNFYSSEFYGEHVSNALGAVDRRIDQGRKRIPISATAIRANPYANRAYLEPLVYEDLIAKVVFLGAPSTGKTTIVEEMAEQYHTCWMPEYGREYWESHQRNRRLSLEQLVEIGKEHRHREDRLVWEADRYLFVDTDATTTRMFSLYYHGRVHPLLEKWATEALTRYDVFFLCCDDIPYEDSWDRSGIMNRLFFQQWIEADLVARRTPFIRLRGDLTNRMQRARGVLSRFEKYCSLPDTLVDELDGE